MVTGGVTGLQVHIEMMQTYYSRRIDRSVEYFRSINP